MRAHTELNEFEKEEICDHYCDTVNNNVNHFIQDKTNKQIIRLENISEDFSYFWNQIGPEGHKKEAMKEFDVLYNKS